MTMIARRRPASPARHKMATTTGMMIARRRAVVRIPGTSVVEGTREMELSTICNGDIEKVTHTHTHTHKSMHHTNGKQLPVNN